MPRALMWGGSTATSAPGRSLFPLVSCDGAGSQSIEVLKGTAWGWISCGLRSFPSREDVDRFLALTRLLFGVEQTVTRQFRALLTLETRLWINPSERSLFALHGLPISSSVHRRGVLAEFATPSSVQPKGVAGRRPT